MDLKMEAALDTRDALAKSIYAALFRCPELTTGQCLQCHMLHAACPRALFWPRTATAAKSACEVHAAGGWWT